jgi:uncharacterized protein
MGIYIIMGLVFLASLGVQQMLKAKFRKYSQIRNTMGLTGREIAERMLHENGIDDVKVISVPGQLTDHYDPIKKTVNLSEPVYSSNSIAAAAVAAHECGHAVQHNQAYLWLTMRSQLVPIVSISSRYVQWILLAGVILLSTFPTLLWLGIGLFALTTIFAFVTLPVEFDASRRALAWLDERGMSFGGGKEQAKDALKWAAMTYVVAAVGSLATLLYYISLAQGRRD